VEYRNRGFEGEKSFRRETHQIEGASLKKKKYHWGEPPNPDKKRRKPIRKGEEKVKIGKGESLGGRSIDQKKRKVCRRKTNGEKEPDTSGGGKGGILKS